MNTILLYFRNECKYLEKNYLECLLQKGLKDRVETPKCNLEYVWYFHTECPDYVKKYDLNDKYLKQQLYNMMSLPYYNFKLDQKNKIDAPTKNLGSKNVEYPESPKNFVGSTSVDMLIKSRLQRNFAKKTEQNIQVDE